MSKGYKPQIYEDFPEDGYHNLKTYHERLDSFLEQFTDYKQYDKFLLALESNLFNNRPRIISPNSDFISLLLTLSTIDNYNRSDTIKNEIHFLVSEYPIRHRANNLLSNMADIFLKSEENQWNKEDLEILKRNLIDSLKFLKANDRVVKRRTATKRKYKEVTTIDRLSTSPIKGTPETDPKRKRQSMTELKELLISPDKEPDADMSPRKRLMLQGFRDLDHSMSRDINLDLLGKSNDSDSDDLEKQILGSQTIEALLISDKVWEMIKWILSCSNSNDKVKLKHWEVWEDTFYCIFKIINVEFQDFKKQLKEKKDVRFEDTLLFHFISVNANLNWEYSFCQAIMVPYDEKLKPFQKDDLNVCDCIHIPPIKKPSTSNIVNHHNAKFIRKVIELAFQGLRFQNGELYSSNWREGKLLTEFSKAFVNTANYNDFMCLFYINDVKLDNKSECIVFLKLIRALIDYISNSRLDETDTTENVRKFEDCQWLFTSEDPEFIYIMYRNTDLFQDSFRTDEASQRSLLESFQKINFLLFKTLEIWLRRNYKPSEGITLPNAVVVKLLKAAEHGDKLRLQGVKTDLSEYNNKNGTNYRTLYQMLRKQLGDPRYEKIGNEPDADENEDSAFLSEVSMTEDDGDSSLEIIEIKKAASSLKEVIQID